MWEWLRTAASTAGMGPVMTDRIWDRMSRSFDALVARRYVPRAQAVKAFEYTALLVLMLGLLLGAAGSSITMRRFLRV